MSSQLNIFSSILINFVSNNAFLVLIYNIIGLGSRLSTLGNSISLEYYHWRVRIGFHNIGHSTKPTKMNVINQHNVNESIQSSLSSFGLRARTPKHIKSFFSLCCLFGCIDYCYIVHIVAPGMGLYMHSPGVHVIVISSD